MAESSRKQPVVDVDGDLEWCHVAVQDVSRTFAISIDVLDEPMASYICVGYLLCRIADTVEDARHIPPDEQVALLETYDAIFDPSRDVDAETFRRRIDPWVPATEHRSPDWWVVTETPRVVRVFDRQPEFVRESVRPPVRELVQGMITFVDRYADEGGLRIQSTSELEEYCYYAAGTVGKLITNLACTEEVPDSRRRWLYDTAESFGLLLQLVNISKDVYDDLRTENNVYLPASWLGDVGVTQEGVCDDSNASEAATVVRRTADHARTFLDDAQAYLEHVPRTGGNRLAAWAIPYLLAVGTLRELSSRPEDALSERGVKMSRREVTAIVTEVVGVTDVGTVEDMRRTIDRGPYYHA